MSWRPAKWERLFADVASEFPEEQWRSSPMCPCRARGYVLEAGKVEVCPDCRVFDTRDEAVRARRLDLLRDRHRQHNQPASWGGMGLLGRR